jgi:hypothetical protein
VQANSTGGQGSRRAVAPSGDDSDNDDGCPSRNVTVALTAPLTELTVCQSDGCRGCERCGHTDPNHHVSKFTKIWENLRGFGSSVFRRPHQSPN